METLAYGIIVQAVPKIGTHPMVPNYYKLPQDNLDFVYVGLWSVLQIKVKEKVFIYSPISKYRLVISSRRPANSAAYFQFCAGYFQWISKIIFFLIVKILWQDDTMPKINKIFVCNRMFTNGIHVLAYSPFVWVTSEKLSQCIVWMECDKMASKQSKAENVCKISKFFRAAGLKTQCMW